MYTKEQLNNYREVMTASGGASGDGVRLAVGTPQALALAQKLKPAQMRHADQLQKAIPQLVQALEGKNVDTSDPDAMLAHANGMTTAVNNFWDAFEGQEVEGVQIIRKR